MPKLFTICVSQANIDESFAQRKAQTDFCNAHPEQARSGIYVNAPKSYSSERDCPVGKALGGEHRASLYQISLTDPKKGLIFLKTSTRVRAFMTRWDRTWTASPATFRLQRA